VISKLTLPGLNNLKAACTDCWAAKITSAAFPSTTPPLA